jgi:hypothetical protein
MDMFGHALVHLEYINFGPLKPPKYKPNYATFMHTQFLCRETNFLQPCLMVGLFIIGFICVYVGICTFIKWEEKLEANSKEEHVCRWVYVCVLDYIFV